MASSIFPLRLLQPSGTDYIPSSHVLRCGVLHTDVASCHGGGGGVGGRECNRSARSRGVYRALGLASRSAKLEEVRLARVPRECARFSRRIA